MPSGAPATDIVAAWSSAHAVAPYDPVFALNRALWAHKAGDPSSAKFASEALKIDELQRLDPLRRLRQAEIAELRAISGL